MPLANPNRIECEWNAFITCKLYELGGSFSIFVFLGPVPSNPIDWLPDESFAGSFDVMAPSQPDPKDPDHLISSGVYLNNAIVKMSGNPSLEEDVVVPFLKSKLNWALSKVGGFQLSKR